MLPAPLLLVSSREGHRGRVTPRYLGGRDEVWVRAVHQELDAFVGRPSRERDADLPARVHAIARDHGVSTRAADGVAHVLAKRFRTRVGARLDPAHVRAIVFEEAARDAVLDRRAALARASHRLAAPTEEILAALFADRPDRKLVAPEAAPLPASELVDAYNLALVQGLLLRSEHVVVEVREHVRAVVRFAKLSGLLCTCSLGRDGTRLDVSGPLSILRHTTKYGFALASFFPAVVATPGFRLAARCVLRDDLVVVHVDATARIARTHALPKDADSAVERALARDVRRLARAWTLARETDAITVGTHAFFPDFTLRHPDGFAVLVEVVGFYTPEYLRGKLAALRVAAARPLVVCIDDSLSAGDGEIPGAVLRFTKRIDAGALLDAADRLRLASERP